MFYTQKLILNITKERGYKGCYESKKYRNLLDYLGSFEIIKIRSYVTANPSQG